MKLYNVFYIDYNGLDEPCYQTTTDNPQKWLFKHNEGRIADGNDPENIDCFDIQEVYLELFNERK